MVPAQRNSRLSLLLLLGLLGMTILVLASPPGIPATERFVIRHINMTSNNCNIAMRVINYYNWSGRICKQDNTFLHIPLNSVVEVCHHENITCRNPKYKNCHSSSVAVSITHCRSTNNPPDYLQCQYQKTTGTKNYDVACNYNYRPVHLDRVY